MLALDRLIFLGALCFVSQKLLDSRPFPIEDTGTQRYFLDDVQADISYQPGLALDAFAPAGPPRPAAIILHGGSGDKSTHVTQLFPLLTKAGYAWFSIDYRTAADIQKAIEFVESPGRFSIQPQPVLIGEDAGVSFALERASRGGFRSVIGFGATKNVASMPDPNIPVVLFHGAADTDVEPKPIEAACRTWVHCRFELIPHGIHNLENWHPAEWDWKEEFTSILRDGRGGLWKDIVYSRPDLPLTMDANLPAGAGPFPAVVVVHGGGWEAGDKLTYVSPVLKLLSQTQFVWFSMDYRLTPYVRNEAQLEDLRNALRYIHNHAQRFKVNPNAIVILGESASGQMVTEVASEPCSGCEVRAVVSFYGVYDFTRWANDRESKLTLDRLFGTWNIAKLRRYSPITHVHAGMPPVLLIQGTADELYSGTMTYEERLTQAGVPHDLILLKGAPHGMENWVGHPEWEIYQRKLLAWLDSVFR